MNQYPKMSPGDIESLAMTRTFAELTDEERAHVAAHLGDEDAYTRMRLAIATTRGTLAAEDGALGLEPAPDIRRAAHAAMLHGERRPALLPGLIGRIARYRVPVYQPTIAALAAVMLVFLVRPEQPMREKVIYRNVAASVAPIDTEEIVRRVVDSLKGELERPARVEVRTIIIHDAGRGGEARMTSGEAPATHDSAAPRKQEAPRGNMFVGLANLKQLDLQRRGKNLAEDSAGSRFMVTSVPDRF